MEIKAAAGDNILYSTAHSVLLVLPRDKHDFCRKIKLPVVLVPGLKRNLCSSGAGAQKGVKTVMAKGGLTLDLGSFTIQLTRSDSLDNLDLAIAKEIERTGSVIRLY